MGEDAEQGGEGLEDSFARDDDTPAAACALRGVAGSYPKRWGAYRFSKTGNFEWQVECPYHMTSRRAYCRKLMGVKAQEGVPLAEAEWQRIQRLHFWAASHGSYRRQWRHMLFHPEYAECPDSELLELQKGTEADRPTYVCTDDELDAEELPSRFMVRREF